MINELNESRVITQSIPMNCMQFVINYVCIVEHSEMGVA